jgi:hypothetical protein
VDQAESWLSSLFNDAELRVETEPLFISFEVFIKKLEFGQLVPKLLLSDITSRRSHEEGFEFLLYLAAGYELEIEGQLLLDDVSFLDRYVEFAVLILMFVCLPEGVAPAFALWSCVLNSHN